MPRLAWLIPATFALLAALTGCDPATGEGDTAFDDAGGIDVGAEPFDAKDVASDAVDSDTAPDLPTRDFAMLDAENASDADVGDSACAPPTWQVDEECFDLAYCANISSAFQQRSNPPATAWSGTVFVTPEILTEGDPTSFIDVTPTGMGTRTMYDRRVAAFVTEEAHLFDARFGSSTTVEVRVNTEFTAAEAAQEAHTYATVIGRLPGFLFEDLQTITIHPGDEDYGGGNFDLLVHTGRTPSYKASGVLEEVFIHEAAHVSMDDDLARDNDWLAAADADQGAISTYARDNPLREDVAETLLPYLALRQRRARIPEGIATQVEDLIPNRIAYLDCLRLNMDALP